MLFDTWLKNRADKVRRIQDVLWKGLFSQKRRYSHLRYEPTSWADKVQSTNKKSYLF